MKKIFLVIVALATFSLPSCSGKVPPVPTQVPDRVETSVHEGAMKALGVLSASTTVLDESSKLYLTIYQGFCGTSPQGCVEIPAAVNTRIRAGFTAAAQSFIDAATKIKQGIASWPELKAILNNALLKVNNLINAVTEVRAASAGGWVSMVKSIGKIVLEEVSGISGEPADLALAGGVR